MRRLARSVLRGVLSEHMVLFLGLGYFLAVWAAVPEMVSPENLSSLLWSALPLLTLAVGQTVVMIAGGIDLSITAVVGLASVVAGKMLTRDDPSSLPIAIGAMISAGLLVGVINGVAVTLLRMPAFIVTLASSMFISGVALWWTRSENISPMPPGLLNLGQAGWLNLSGVVWIVIAVALFAHFTLSETVFGRWTYATGLNPRAALISGVPLWLVAMSVYMFSGLCGALTGLISTVRLESASPTHGERMLLDVIGAVVIGGTSLFGGRGKILWTLFGVAFFAVLTNSLDLLNFNQAKVTVTKGAVIFIAALLDLLRTRFAHLV